MDTNTPSPGGESPVATTSSKPSVNEQIKRNQRKRIIIGAVILFAIISIGMLFTAKTKKKNEISEKVDVKKSVVLKEDIEKEVWMTEAGGKVKAMETENKELRTALERLEKKMEKGFQDGEAPEKKLRGAKDKKSSAFPSISLDKILNNDDGNDAKNDDGGADEDVKGGPNKNKKLGVKKTSDGDVIMPPNAMVVRPPSSFPYASNSAQPQQQPGQALPQDGQNGQAEGIKTFRPEKSIAEKSKETTNTKDPAWLPSGSFVKAVLLSGLDAPTNSGANASPYPVLLRLMDNAVLPNKFRMDIKDCFIVGESYGDISSERAFIRTTQMSCVRNDTTTIDTSFKGYISGEDGKVGLRGRLVSKDGTMIARALMAGFISGISSAFKPSTSISLTSSDSTSYSFPSASTIGTATALGGTSKAAEILSQHYVDMAKNIYPIIEIDAGRLVDIVVTNGMELNIKENK